MQKLINTLLLILFMSVSQPVLSAENDDATAKLISGIGFHKKLETTPQQQIQSIFVQYEKFINKKDMNNLLSLYDDTYQSADGNDKDSIKTIADEVWNNFPNIKTSVKILSINVDIDNATVITKETLSGAIDSNIQFIKGQGYLESEATTIYYLQRFSNEWRIISEFVVNEKTIMRYGVAKFIPMQLDAPSIVAPDENYTAILQATLPNTYKALITIDNEHISQPNIKAPESFRGLKDSGIQERVLKSNSDDKNENAVASVGIVKTQIGKDNINIKIIGLAFLSSRVNVIKHKQEIDKKELSINHNSMFKATTE